MLLRFSPLEAGLAFIPATGTVMLTATQFTRRVLPRFGVRKILLTGMAITGLGQVWLFTISNTGSYQLNVLGGIMITAFGMGLRSARPSVSPPSPPSPRPRPTRTMVPSCAATRRPFSWPSRSPSRPFSSSPS